MSAEQINARLKYARLWLAERPWVRVMLNVLFWIAVAMGVQQGGAGAVGVAMVVAALVVGVLLAAFALADYVNRDQSDIGQRQRTRNIAIAIALGGMAVMFYAATMVRMGGAIVGRPQAIVAPVILGSFVR